LLGHELLLIEDFEMA